MVAVKEEDSWSFCLFVTGNFTVSDDVASEDESIPIVVVIPGLTSDSSSQVGVSIYSLILTYA